MTRHDLLVIGGGIAGTLAVLAAASRGIDVAWIAEEVGPLDQSAHWHGHLHRGRLYDPIREADLIAELAENVPFWWDERIQDYHAGVDTIAVGPDFAWADEFRRFLRGARGEEARFAFLRGDAVAVHTDEAILDGPRFLSAATAAAESAAQVHRSRCTALRRTGSTGWQASVEVPGGDSMTVRADRVILATGTRLGELLPAGVRLDRDHGYRLSRMLVLRGPLPRAAAIVPSRAAGGLFFASREIPGSPAERIWLVSDGFSSHGTRSPGALTDAWWACSVMERMYGFVREDVFEDVRAAAYIAPKSRLDASPTEVPAHGFAADDRSAFVALTPSKWSSSPTAAVNALHRLVPDDLGMDNRLASIVGLISGASGASAAPMIEETWQTLDPAIPVSDLRRPGQAALVSAARMFGHDLAATSNPGRGRQVAT